TFDAGSASNLNVIPMAAVERIEILSEGASALYGDSAIGGAINIITRSDMEGFSFSATAGRPSREGGDEQAAAVTGAVRSDRGSISFALDHAEQDLVFNADRDYSAVGLSSFGFPGSFFASGPNGESLGTFPDPRCPASDGTGVPSGEGEFPDSVVLGTRCRYNYAGVSANEASLSRTSLFVNGEFELTDSVDAFGRVIFSSTESMGRIAPTPQVGGSPFLPTMSAANPNNPTNPANVTNANGDDLTPFHNLGGLTGPFDLSIFYRNVPGGFRDTVVDDQLLDVVAGVRTDSERMGGVSFEVTAQHSEHTSDSTTNGLASRSALQQAIDDGSYDIFGVNGPTDPAIAQSIARTATVDAKTEYDALRAEVTLNGLRVGAASLPVRFGAQTANESYGIDYDSLSNAGLLDGTAGGDDVSGDRRISSVYGGATLNLGRRLQVDGQLRTDDYDASGSANSQRLAASLALVPGVTLHGSASRGFRAPTLAQLNAGTAQSFNGAIDVISCAQASPGSVDENGNVIDPQGSACVATQYQNLLGGNPELSLESSTAWTAGVTLEPGDDLRLSVTAYSIEIEDQVGTSTLQQILANEFVNGGSDLVERDANGNIVQILNNNQNVGSTRTSGMSLDATAGAYRTGLGPGARLSANYIREIERETIPGAGFARSPGVFEPNLRANLDLLWRFTDDVELVVNGNYVGETSFTDQSSSLDAWLTWDAQLQVEFPWQGSLAVGARNLFDEDPPTDPGLGNPFYRNQLHNPYGIVPYVRYTQEL
ncbi:MAG: TonB-dependent receptor, partial [Gammaproteobacteria bacterium]